ncbi:MAG: hypothetical protein GF347_00740 [Candidatus Moranbacteria bacterium]|nr:hypothetical protein [Candidatus Moranbacteria bacterium]
MEFKIPAFSRVKSARFKKNEGKNKVIKIKIRNTGNIIEGKLELNLRIFDLKTKIKHKIRIITKRK